jgi:hypothetical protein
MTENKLLKEKLSFARTIREEKGLFGVVGAVITFAVNLAYFKAHYFLDEHPLVDTDIQRNLGEREPDQRSVQLNFKVVRTNQEAEQLEKMGFEFRSHPYVFNTTTTYQQMLEFGMIAFCTFVDRKFAAISWVIPSKRAQRKFGAPPLRVDYANGEAMVRAAWCDPQYRGLGIYRYNAVNRDRYLAENGFKRLKSAENFENQAGIRLSKGMRDVCYGQATYVRILGWGFWREVYHGPT